MRQFKFKLMKDQPEAKFKLCHGQRPLTICEQPDGSPDPVHLHILTRTFNVRPLTVLAKGQLQKKSKISGLAADRLRIGLGRVPGYPRFGSGVPITRIQIHYQYSNTNYV